MNQNNQNEQLNKIGNWISPKMDKFESIIVLVLIAGLTLRTMSDLKADILIVLPLSTLSLLYFLKVYSISGDENAGGLVRFIDKLVSYSSSIATIGILFRLEHWPGSNIMLICGCVTLIILFPIILILKSKNSEIKMFNYRLVIRVFIIAILGLALRFTQKEDLVKMGIDKNVTIENSK